ncbi:MAG: BatA domain-containing protein [Planctomycetota bacterium]
MSFLSGLFLLALPMIGVPIALHFYKGRQVDTVDWGAMAFLVDAVSEGRRWEKLEDLLLMLLRAAVVAALVFALAQPMVRGSWIGVHDRREVVIVVDDSLSTAIATDDSANARSVFQLIQEQAIEAVNNLNAADQVQLLAAAGGGRWQTLQPVAATASGQRQLADSINALQPTQGSANLLECVQSAMLLEPLEGATERLILLVTDGQATAFTAESQEAWSRWAVARDKAELPTTVRVVDCGLGDAAPGDLAIGNVEASRTVVRPGEQVKLSCDVANLGFAESKSAIVAWQVGEETIATSSLGSITPGETRQASANTPISGTGPQLVRCVLQEEDQLALDNSAPIVIEVADRLPILIVEAVDADMTDSDRAIAASQHLSAALGYLEGEPQAWRSVYEPTVITPTELADTNMSEFRAVVLTNPTKLNQEEVDQLQGFVAAGGGLWLTLGDRLDADRFNSQWHDDGEGLCPLAIGKLTSEEGFEEDSPLRIRREDRLASSGSIAIHPPEPDHPTTKNLANTTQLDIDKTLINRHWQFSDDTVEDALGEEADREVSILLRTRSGDALAVERYFGRGRVIVQAFPHQLSWTSLPINKAYVVMVQDWLDYLTAPSLGRHNLTPGAEIVAQAPVGDGTSAGGYTTASIQTPTGEEIDLAERGDLAASVFRFTQTRLPGAYTLQFSAAGDVVDNQPFQVPRRLAESTLDPLTESERVWFEETAGLQFGTQSPTVASVTDTTAEPSLSPFWWTLLACVAALLAVELLLASHVSWRRMGEPLVAA